MLRAVSDDTETPNNDQRKLAQEFNDLRKAAINISKEVVKTWKIVVMINTCAMVAIVLLNGFENLRFHDVRFHISDISFITTVSALTISSFLLGIIRKILKFEN